MSADEHDGLAQTRVGGAADRRLLGRLLVFARPHRVALAGTVGLLVAGLGLRLAGPWIIRQVVDGPVARALELDGTPDLAAETPELLAQVTRWSLLFLGAGASLSLLLVVREWLMNRTGQRIVLTIRNTLFHHVLRLPVSWFDRHHVGWTVTRTTSDVDALSELFTTGVATIAYDILTILVVVGVLVALSPPLAVVALVVLPVMIAVSFRFRLKARMAYRATRKSLSRLNGFLQERLTGLAVVRLFRRERASSARFETLNGRYYDDNMATVRHFSAFFPTVDVLSWIVRLGTLSWGSWLLADESLTLGTLLQFWLYLDFVFEPIRELAERYNVLQAAMAAGERIYGILDAPTEAGPATLAATVEAMEAEAEQDEDRDRRRTPARRAAPARAESHPDGRGAGSDTAAAGDARTRRPPGGGPGSDTSVPALEFEHVSFAYPGGPDVLGDLSFRVERGQRVAIVGHTGAGKTTIVSLLCRFHETDRGTVRVGGTDVRELPHAELRRRIAIVQQDVFLFSDTIAANIRMGAADLSDDEMAAMGRAVNADRFVDRLPERWETRLRERGSNLSSGQRQLVAFARALAADPDVLVLDEATSSVDSETEHWIEEATSTLMAGRTSLVIAHRLSTIVGADRILVMHKGRLREQGTHDELLAARGLYHRLYHLHLAVEPTQA